MKNTKKGRPGDSSTRAAAETAAFDRAPVPCKDSTTAAEVRQIQISDFLSAGEQNAVPLRHLVQITGLPGRDLRRRIQAERLSGVPILSDNISGYFLPADDQERRRFVQSMRSRAKEIEATAAAVERGQPND